MFETGTDSGYSFLGPKIVGRTMPLANGLTLEATHQSGVVVSLNPQSPLYHATMFIQGTTAKDVAGVVLEEVELVEFTDPDGNLTLMYGLNWRVDDHYMPT
jgi:hypothetical protein